MYLYYDGCISKIIQIIIMLTDLQKVQNSFYNNESIQEFLSKNSIHQIIKFLNKSTKTQTRTRIKQFFYKLNESNHYKDFLVQGINQAPQHKAQFLKYITSEFCEQYFQLLQKKPADVATFLENNVNLAPMIFSLVYSPNSGIKMIKVFNEIYSKNSHVNNLYSEEIRTQLKKGLQSEDSIVAMRFVEIIANIAIHGGKSFQFVKEALEKSLDLYESEDVLLKLNLIQIISILGSGKQTSQLLRGHKVWSKVQKDALDPQQQFYVRKGLLILLVDMMTYQQYNQTPKFTKSLIQFLDHSFKSQGENLEAGLQVAAHLLRSNEGAKILLQNGEVFGSFLKISRSPQDRIKNLFVECLIVLTDKTTGKKTKQMVMNILNCVGNPNLSNELTHNMNSNNFMTGGIDAFTKWFVGLLQLPFQDLQIKLLQLFINLLEYIEICEDLFENQNVTKYILRPVGKGNTVKVLRSQKNRFVQSLFEKGSKQWKNTKLEQYTVMIEKQLQKQKMEMEIQMQAS